MDFICANSAEGRVRAISERGAQTMHIDEKAIDIL